MWVLIVAVLGCCSAGGSGKAITTAEFSSRERCIAAARSARTAIPNLYVACAQK